MALPHNHNLIAVRDAKERAVELISGRYSEDLIDASELDRRLERVEQARTLEEIAVVTDDLLEPGTSLFPLAPADTPPTGALAPVSPAGQALVVRDVPARRDFVALFGEQRQVGAWVVPRELDSFTVFGSTVLDFREAQLQPGVTELDVKVMMGSVTIIVPPGLAVENHCAALFGAVERDDGVHEVSPQLDATAPRLRVRGFVLFGAVEIRQRHAGESGRDARKRRKRERKALRREQKARKKMLGRGS